MSTAQRKVSRSILANRLNQFATLYDPDAGQDDDDSEAGRPARNPVRTEDDGGEVVSIPLSLNSKEYTNYRITRCIKNPECHYCGCKLPLNSGNSLDHVLAKSRGGGDWPANLLLSCKRCNSEKGMMTPAEWLVVLEEQTAELSRRVEMLRSKIAESGLDYFTPTRSIEDIRNGSPSCKASTPDKTNGKTGDKQESFTPEPGMNEWMYDVGRRWFSIVRTSDRKRLIKHLTGPDILHYLKCVGLDPYGELQLVCESSWRPKVVDKFD